MRAAAYQASLAAARCAATAPALPSPPPPPPTGPATTRLIKVVRRQARFRSSFSQLHGQDGPCACIYPHRTPRRARRRCRGGRRTASITAGIFPREAETDRKPGFLGPCYHHSIRRQGSHLGHPSFAIFSYSISTTPIFFPHLGQFVEKGVGTGDGKGSCYDENDRWPEKSAASSERNGVGDFDLDAQNGK